MSEFHSQTRLPEKTEAAGGQRRRVAETSEWEELAIVRRTRRMRYAIPSPLLWRDDRESEREREREVGRTVRRARFLQSKSCFFARSLQIHTQRVELSSNPFDLLHASFFLSHTHTGIYAKEESIRRGGGGGKRVTDASRRTFPLLSRKSECTQHLC